MGMNLQGENMKKQKQNEYSSTQNGIFDQETT